MQLGADIVVRRKATQDAISALIALGYKPQAATKAVTQCDDAQNGSEALIRAALRRLAS